MPRATSVTVNLTNNATTIAVPGGALLATNYPGDTLIVRGLSYPIRSIDTNEQATLEYAYPGPSEAGVACHIERRSDLWASGARLAEKLTDTQIALMRGYRMRSGSSVAIGIGTKTFIVSETTPILPGVFLTISSAADPTKWMSGQLTSFSGFALVMDITATNGTGTFADWNINLTGSPGSAGIQGAPGIESGVRFTFASSTAMADPGVGLVRFNNAAFASITQIAVDDQCALPGNPSVETQVLGWDDSDSNVRGYLKIVNAGAQQNFAEFAINGATVDNVGWSRLSVSLIASSGSMFGAGDTLLFQFTRNGDRGTVGNTGPAAWSPPVAWAASTAYAVGPPASVVSYLGETYVCTTAHTSTASFDAAKFLKISAKADLNLPVFNSGRLTLVSGTPITTSDVVGASTLYFTPIHGAYLSLYDGSAWIALAFAETALPLTHTVSATRSSTRTITVPDTSIYTVGDTIAGTGIGAAATIASITNGTSMQSSVNHTSTGTANITVSAVANTLFDVFGYISGGALKLERVKWTDATTRATGLVWLNGVRVKNGDATRRYLGTFRTDSTAGVTTDSRLRRFVWNALNQKRRLLKARETTSSWTYSIIGTWRPANANANGLSKVVFVLGDPDDVTASVAVIAFSNDVTKRSVSVAIGVDSDTTPDFDDGTQGYNEVNINRSPLIATYNGAPGIGYHSLTWLEMGGGTDIQTFVGPGYGSGLRAALQG